MPTNISKNSIIEQEKSKNFEIEVKGLIESSFLDWDGKIVSTIYLPKCNYRCPFCHNWELIETPEKFKTISNSEIDRLLLSNHDFLDGVCITGGEPTLYSGLCQYIDHLRDLGLKIKLDTNGTNPKMLEELIEEGSIDYIAMDLKGPLDERYERLTGVKTDLVSIKKSIDIIMSSGVDYEFRTTVVPTLIGAEDIKDISMSISNAKKYVLQQFVPNHARDEELRETEPYPKEILQEFQKIAKEYIKVVETRGLR